MRPARLGRAEHDHNEDEALRDVQRDDHKAVLQAMARSLFMLSNRETGHLTLRALRGVASRGVTVGRVGET